LKFSLFVALNACLLEGDSWSGWRGVDSLDGIELPMPLDFQILLIQQVAAALHSNWDEYTIAPWTGGVKRLSWGMGRLAAYKMLSKAS